MIASRTMFVRCSNGDRWKLSGLTLLAICSLLVRESIVKCVRKAQHPLGTTDQTTYSVLAEPQGEPLAACLRNGRSRAGLLLLMRKLVSAVQQLHAAGFVHDNLSLRTIQVCGPQQDVMLADRGTINRPMPFEPGAELRTLGS